MEDNSQKILEELSKVKEELNRKIDSSNKRLERLFITYIISFGVILYCLLRK